MSCEFQTSQYFSRNFNPLLTIWSFFLQVSTNSPFQFFLNRSSGEKYSQLLEFRLNDRVLKKVTQVQNNNNYPAKLVYPTTISSLYQGMTKQNEFLPHTTFVILKSIITVQCNNNNNNLLRYFHKKIHGIT